ncbi:hypothetical protein ACFYWN_31420 [Streptomyces sp. NPDC002917]|uniref:hypothetical protein n=1 Tax=unclassified Streptomyces TaxID=2593676 RepID=UPI002E7FD217|nr:hypothetical protein [Streptomyces sp. NBC_00562]WTC81062.1 hypothetical protein OH719_26355 [Streptomyces sp. NBC_01653]WTD34364.1 hypothetical protein OHB03_20170 [Streptomyces sp. NBC_01643]WTD89804.1 hypothetical protein OG891_20515 [Streptomyces sp. NBC_01637]WUC20819.1 hypothetical protein OHA33_19145 [Streptomyces sp. NBC_00562]
MYDQHTDEAPPAAPSAATAPPTHEPFTIERGSFCIARCSCGWTGPARRSRDRARTDAEEHRSAP